VNFVIMTGLAPTIHVLFPLQSYKEVDAQHKAVPAGRGN
jgi:hypothetical protein